jgi:D-tagatose-1,6-bisphosphate aldolase subunit GatZ/KbaZ
MVAETSAGEGASRLRYVIGTEVPSAGGAKAGENRLAVTNPADAAQTIELTHRAFSSLGLDSAWERVIALVVQPGVEFGDESVRDYDRSAAAWLARFIETVPCLVYEAHSTDYQTPAALRGLVEDHFAILKVGPGLTFAFREAVFALAEMEEILVEGETSHLRETLEAAMLENPAHWQEHYGGTSSRQKYSRAFSYSDRVRYYWNVPAVREAFPRLMKNLGDVPLPLSLISQYFPKQYEKIRSGKIRNHPRELLLGRVTDVLDDYAFACGDGST